FPEDVRQLVERDVDFEDVVTGVFSGFTLAALRVVPLLPGNRIARVPVPFADAAALLVPVDEPRDVDLRNGDGDEVSPLPADHLPLRDVATQVLADLPPNDVSES